MTKLSRTNSCLFGEERGEMKLRVKSKPAGNFLNGLVGIKEQALRMCQTDGMLVVLDRQSGRKLKVLSEMCFAQGELLEEACQLKMPAGIFGQLLLRVANSLFHRIGDRWLHGSAARQSEERCSNSRDMNPITLVFSLEHPMKKSKHIQDPVALWRRTDGVLWGEVRQVRSPFLQ